MSRELCLWNPSAGIGVILDGNRDDTWVPTSNELRTVQLGTTLILIGQK